MKLGISSLQGLSDWQQMYSQLPTHSQSPFFSPGYYQAYQAVDQGEVECFWAYQDKHNYFIYPYIKKSINALGYNLGDEYFDISGAYGYNGPLGVATDDAVTKCFNEQLCQHLHQSKVVTELVRYCPITENRRFHTYTRQIDVLDNVYVTLENGLDWIWNESLGRRVRTAVRKGESYNLRSAFFWGEAITTEELMCFYNIYTSTMDRNSADGFYYFDFEFFAGMRKYMGKMLLLAITYLGDVAITSELVILEGSNSFGFLGGTLSEYYSYKANTFQRWELLKYLSSIGIKKYSMGGGATRGDSIYDYKMSFAKGCENPFFIGTKVHIPDVYEEIRIQWAAKYPKAAEKHSAKLQGYRIIG